MKTQFIKMQSEHTALILFFALIFSIIGAVISVLCHYPPPAYILASAALGVAAGGIIAARRESRFIASVFQVEIDKADKLVHLHTQHLYPPRPTRAQWLASNFGIEGEPIFDGATLDALIYR
jgi:hypothetical protein